jgi:hypothetical protein
MIFSGLTDLSDADRWLWALGSVLALWLCWPGHVSADTPRLKLAPEELRFGRQAVNSASDPQSVSVTNNGSASVALYQITSSGIDFKQSNNCPASLAPAASCSISVVFQPAIDGPREGAVLIFGSDGISPHTIAVMGEGNLGEAK